MLILCHFIHFLRIIFYSSCVSQVVTKCFNWKLDIFYIILRPFTNFDKLTFDKKWPKLITLNLKLWCFFLQFMFLSNIYNIYDIQYTIYIVYHTNNQGYLTTYLPSSVCLKAPPLLGHRQHSTLRLGDCRHRRHSHWPSGI